MTQAITTARRYFRACGRPCGNSAFQDSGSVGIALESQDDTHHRS